MSLTLQIISRQRQALGGKSVMTFGQDGGTIGRSLDTNWSLPDSQRFLSSKHASIDFRSGSYYIVDTSKNGVFINDSEQPVGQGKPQRLFPGDRVRIGEYEMLVSIENVDDTRESLLSTSHVDPVDLKQRVEPPEPTSYNLVEAHVITGVGIEMFLEEEEAESPKPLYSKFRSGESSSRIESPAPARLELVAEHQEPAPVASTSQPAPRASRPAAKPSADRAEAPQPARNAASKQAPRSPAAGAAEPPSRRHTVTEMPARQPAGSAVDAFFRGAGIDSQRLDARQAEQLMFKLGQVTREFVVGMIDLLHVRALQKAQLKQSNTTIQAKDNNRLKFSANFEEGFQRLFVDESDQYLEPVESVRSACAELKVHQRALLSATRRALDEYLERLEPELLEQRASGGRAGALINAANKFKYWDLYKDVYAILANRPQNELPQPFLDALANAYEEATQTPKKVSADAEDREVG